MWAIAPDGFTPVSDQKEILGTLTATFDLGGGKVFTYSGSVNSTNAASLTDFVAQAKKALAAAQAQKTNPFIAGVVSALNK